MTRLNAATTYVRKIADGQYEYGFVRRSDNFRKRPDVYSAEGTCANLLEAEGKRAALEFTESTR